ncbi:MAG: MarR family winged helix-turn-helix transcriptional regulator [Bacteroidota bacterium]
MKKIEEEIQQKKFRSALQKAIINIIYTCNWVQHKHKGFFSNFGITGQQFNILRILKGQHPNTISAKEIKSRMLDRNSDVSRLLERLAAKNLIEKKTCIADKRAYDVFITEKGLALLYEIEKSEKELDAVLSLSENEAHQLSDLLDKSREYQTAASSLRTKLTSS